MRQHNPYCETNNRFYVLPKYTIALIYEDRLACNTLWKSHNIPAEYIQTFEYSITVHCKTSKSEATRDT